MKIVKNYLFNASYQVFLLIVPLITTPYLARVLGPKGVGINAFTLSIIQYFIVFGSIGINLYGNRQIAFVRDDRRKLTKTFFEIFFLKLMMISIACLVFGVFLLSIKEYQAFLLAQSLLILAAGLDVSWFFMGIENFSVTVLRSFLVKIVSIIGIFTLVKTSSDLLTYVLIISGSTVLGNLLLFPSLRRYLKYPNFSKLQPFKHFLPALVLFVPEIATQVYLVLNKTMLGGMISVESAGYFDQSDKLIKVVLAIVTATGTVMLPRVANAFAKGETEKTKNYLYGTFSFVTAMSIPMMLGLIAVSSKFVQLFLTESFKKVAPILMIEAIVILLIAWSNVIGIQYLLPTKQTKIFTSSVVLGAIVNLITNVTLILKFGAIGAAIATVLAELVVTVYQLINIRRQINYSKLFEDTSKYLLAGFLMFGLVFYLDKLWTNCWIALFAEMVIGILFYIGLLIVFKTKIISKAKIGLTMLRKKFRGKNA